MPSTVGEMDFSVLFSLISVRELHCYLHLLILGFRERNAAMVLNGVMLLTTVIVQRDSNPTVIPRAV